MPEGFYVRDGERLFATEYTRGPWDATLQHGGPPAALLAGAIERFGADAADFLVARLSFEFLRPVPLGAFTITTVAVRLGTKAQRIDAHLWLEGVEVARVHALRIRRGVVPLPSPRCPRHGPPRGPAGLEPWLFPFFRERVGYHTGVEVRLSRGVWGKGPTCAWLRLRVPLVVGEPTSPLEGLVLVSDSGNGVCAVLDTRAYTFVNPDLTLHLDRAPCGEWFALDARSTADPLGIGLTQSELHDRDGELGRALASLVIESRDDTGAASPDGPTIES